MPQKSGHRKGSDRVVVENELTVDSITLGDIGGDVSHDSADSGKPIKLGGKAIDMAPDTDAEQGPSDVSADDRVNVLFDLQGALVERVNARYNVLDNVSVTYDDDPVTATSTGIDCSKYRDISLGLTLAKASSPTSIDFQLEGSLDGTKYHEMQAAQATQQETAAGEYLYPVVSIACQKVRLKVTANGTDASNTFTVSNATFYLRN
jgi:hypothetical protein